MRYITLEDFYNNLDKFLSKDEDTICVIYDKIEVNYGDQNDCDIDFCIQNNIPAYNIKRNAGCCVNQPGNINIANIRSTKYDWLEHQIIPDFVKYLKSKDIDAIIDGNDILVDGLKVCSAAGQNLAPLFNKTYTCIQFSLFQDVDLIRNICRKEMKKTPGALSDYGLTTEEVVEWIENWFSNCNKIQVIEL